MRLLGGLGNLVRATGYSLRHRRVLRARSVSRAVKNTLMLTNRAIGRLPVTDPRWALRRTEYDRVVVELTRAKWAASEAMRSGRAVDWTRSVRLHGSASTMADALHALVTSEASTSLDLDPIELEDHGTEILFADGAPLVPSISPIVLLEGSDYDMGDQYARQLVEIFGAWVLERNVGSGYDVDQAHVLRRWETQIESHAPEFLAFFRGWADGARASGVPMSYDDVLKLWTGHEPPSSTYIGEGGLPELGYPLCSGLAAWGRATRDGKLVTGSSGDHDPGHAVTVVAFPDSGFPFVFTPFGADGGVPAAGPLYFFGHPGMNAQGLAYVHHGGGPKMIEPKATWGYGLRRALSVMHVLRFCDTLDAARRMQASFPVGDAGMGDPATAGGFWADGTGAFSIESTADPVIVRESGTLGETDFLYATNAPMHPDVAAAPWMRAEPDGWAWSAPGGWRPTEFTPFSLRSMADPHLMGLRWAWFSAFQRNRQAFAALAERVGRIDVAAMIDVYRTSGTIPDGEWKDVVRAYARERWEPAVGNASNALVVIMKPQDGVYMHCVGEAARGLAPLSARSSAPIRDETNAFWRIRLCDAPEDVVRDARERAEELVGSARDRLGGASVDPSVERHLAGLLDEAEAELNRGVSSDVGAGNERTRGLALRAFTRGQVRAQQIIQALGVP